MENERPNLEERLMAAVAHASVIITGPGVLVGVLIWVTQKEKSRYAANQAVQATIFQLIGTVVVIGLWMLYALITVIATIPLIQHAEQYENAPPPPFFIASLLFMIVPIVIMFAWWIYGLWGAFRCWQGVDFKYLFLGRFTAEKMGSSGS